jgi:hypothetical protein
MDRHWHAMRTVTELPSFKVGYIVTFDNPGSGFNGQAGQVIRLGDVIEGVQGYVAQARALVPAATSAEG